MESLLQCISNPYAYQDIHHARGSTKQGYIVESHILNSVGMAIHGAYLSPFSTLKITLTLYVR